MFLVDTQASGWPRMVQIMANKKMLTALTAAGLVLGLGACSFDSSPSDEERASQAHEERQDRLRQRMEDAAPATPISGPEESFSPESDELAPNLPIDGEADVSAAEAGAFETKPADHAVAASAVTPGARAGSSVQGSCSLGFFAQSASGDLVSVTAAHCTEMPGDVVTEEGEPIGTYGRSLDDEMLGDYGEILISDSQSRVADPKIGGRYTVSRVVDPSELDTDTEVCKWGVTTGESCGTLFGTAGNMGFAGFFSEMGDSGAPVYTRPSGGAVDIVGVLQGSGRNQSSFTYAAAALEDLGLTPVS